MLLSVGTVSISLSIRQLVNSYMLQRTDSQLLQQAELVFKNTTLLNDTKSTADSNSFVSYYVQAYDSQTGRTYQLLQPMYRDGVVSRPMLPHDGGLDGHEIAVPYTTPAVVDLENMKGQPDHETMVMAQAPWRVVALRWVSDSANGTIEPRGVIYIGLSLGNQIDMIDNLTRFCIIVGAAVVLLGGVLSAITVQRTLSPLKRIEKTAAKIAAGDLSQRVPDAPEGTEVGTLAKSLNTMLAQIERSFRQQQTTTEKMKRFVSDASHELRTPLAAIHGYAELYRMQRNAPGQIERADDSIAHIEASSARMTLLVEDLLSLARLDEGHGISITDHIDLGSVIRDSADDLHALDPERDITTGVLGLDVSEPDHLRLSMTPGELPSVMMVADGTRLHQARHDGCRGALHRPRAGRAAGRSGADLRTVLHRRPVPRAPEGRHGTRHGNRAIGDQRAPRVHLRHRKPRRRPHLHDRHAACPRRSGGLNGRADRPWWALCSPRPVCAVCGGCGKIGRWIIARARSPRIGMNDLLTG